MVYTSPFPDVAIPEVPLTQFLFAGAATRADKPALIDGPTGRTLTYGQLVGAIRLVAASLAKRGLKKGDVFAIYSPNLPEYAVAFHAVASLGAINTTVNPLYTAHELANQLKDAGARYLLTIPQFLPNALAAAQEVGGIEEIFVFGEAEGATPFASLLKSDGQLPPVEINPKEDLVVLPYSSGTTGFPKGVMLTHYNLVANVTQCVAAPSLPENEVRESDIVLGLLPFYHIYGMVVIMSWALYKGATVVTMPRFDMEQFLGTMQKYAITNAILVPPIILGLAKHPLVAQYDLSKLRLVVSGAAPLGADLEAAVQQRLNVSVMQGYGMTEASPVTHFRGYHAAGKTQGRQRGCAGTQHKGAGRGRRHGGRPGAEPGRRAVDLGAAGDEGLFEQPRRDGGHGRRRGLAAHGRHRLCRRGLLLLDRRPRQGADQVQRLPGGPGGTGGDPGDAPGRRRCGRGRRAATRRPASCRRPLSCGAARSRRRRSWPLSPSESRPTSASGLSSLSTRYRSRRRARF